MQLYHFCIEAPLPFIEVLRWVWLQG